MYIIEITITGIILRSVTLIVSKMDTLMVAEAMALSTNEISHEEFSNNLMLHKYKFHEDFKRNVRHMLPRDAPGINVSNIGYGYKFFIMSFILFDFTYHLIF